MTTDKRTGDEVLGRGIAFPLQLSGGQIGMNAFDDQVRQSMLLILRTAQGERVMRPEFGAGLDGLAFEPMDAVTVGLVKHRVTETLQRFEHRIDVLAVTVEAKPYEGRLEAFIQYRVRRTDSVNNLVYPFYLERGEV
jgi:uncharacterized protein